MAFRNCSRNWGQEPAELGSPARVNRVLRLLFAHFCAIKFLLLFSFLQRRNGLDNPQARPK